ncbi:MAG TPA: carboxypeptidase-like regulatory domain-containing protein [Flavobacterium sp.]|uniref:carboxypeptidase-like regulatory domain-containing protein n=1 Tax=Flavobacterium sp. TaxID=239 RepID=UPI002D151737|nr:carboxypeptidase-like regulatory domain-containing protein [Flavobacterium sp.]HSD14216.1 carboxypeptidase-like regulatory domain-containing protein [Flavobacterium sp.]
MKEKLLLLIFFVCTVVSFAQEKKITVVLKNEKNQEVIPGATVSVVHSNQGAVSNEDGTFRLTLQATSEIVITHLTFKTIVLSSDNLKLDENVVFMQENDIQMEEMIISKIPIYQVLSVLVDNSAKRLSMPIHLNTYCREFIKNQGKYSRFTDGLVDLHIKGKAKKVDIDAIAIQNRSYGLNEDDPTSEQLIGFNLDKIIENTYEFRALKKLCNKKSEKDYDFEIKSNPSDENIYIINITPKKEVEKLLYNFKVAYNRTENLILSVEYKIADSHIQYSKEMNLLILKFLIKKENFKANFKLEKDRYFLANTFSDVCFKAWNKRSMNYDLEASNALVVKGHSDENFSYDKKDIMNKPVLARNENNIKSKYWEFDSGLTPTTDEEKIIEKLAAKS